ncbi:major capsid protein [Microviridae sp.]|nr:major capsid protein [Microviridae sp.]
MRSNMTHQFSQVPSAAIPRSSFNRSCSIKTTLPKSGILYPILVDEALPGDTFNVNMTGFSRLATPIHPIMDNLFMETFFFAVPIRLVWNNWQKFNGEQENPGDSTDYLIPIMNSPATTGHEEGSLSDYFGIPTGVPDLEHSSLWHRAYALCWNEWFRDQNIQDSLPINKGDGQDVPGDYPLLNRGKRHDYFTSCLPWPQKGESVSIPLGTTAPVTSTGGAIKLANNADATDRTMMTQTNAGVTVSTSPSAPGNAYWGADTGLQTDLTNATAATINSLRQSFQVQKLLERDARGGTRYTEIIRAHFGVVSPDARLQRPEFLGGGSTPINITPIAQTESSDATTPQGSLAAMGTAGFSGHGFTKSFTEHCLILGMVCVRADLHYQQGLPRMFSRSTRYDFYWPALAHIGEQAVLQKEIYASGVPAEDDLVFGYQERWAEMRYKPSLVTGQMRSNSPETLDTWHLAQDFAQAPTLDENFIQENPPVDRVIAVPTAPHFIFDGYFDMRCARPMPLYGVPGLIDHF